jgi:hypothetical protein
MFILLSLSTRGTAGKNLCIDGDHALTVPVVAVRNAAQPILLIR